MYGKKELIKNVHIPAYAGIFTLMVLIFLVSWATADDIPVLENYPPVNTDTNSNLHPGFFPTVVVTALPEPTAMPTMAKAKITKETNDDSGMAISISAFTLSSGANNQKVIGGAVVNEPTDATVTIYGKKADSKKLNQLDIIKPDANGLFIWEVPADADYDSFSADITSKSGIASSEQVKFSKKHTTE